MKVGDLVVVRMRDYRSKCIILGESKHDFEWEVYDLTGQCVWYVHGYEIEPLSEAQ